MIYEVTCLILMNTGFEINKKHCLLCTEWKQTYITDFLGIGFGFSIALCRSTNSANRKEISFCFAQNIINLNINRDSMIIRLICFILYSQIKKC